MKILWLAAYPSPRITREHPVPWIVALAALLARDPRVEFTILSWSSDSKQPVEEFDHDGVHFIYLRSPSVRNDILSLYQTRIRRTASYLRRHCKQYDLVHMNGSDVQLQVAVGLPLPSVQGLLSECVKVLPGGFSWRRLLWSLARHYEVKYLPHVFLGRTHWDARHVARLSSGRRVFHNWEVIREKYCSDGRHSRAAPGGRPKLRCHRGRPPGAARGRHFRSACAGRDAPALAGSY